MKEIGGYIELDQYRLPMLHEKAIKLNCARNCLAYLIETKNIIKIALPKFLCNSIFDVCKKYKLEVSVYSIGHDLKPKNLRIHNDEWLYLVNYYGLLSNEYIQEMREKYHKIIVDNTQAYFQKAVNGIDTFYTCRKFFGVPDGAVLYTDTRLERNLHRDCSFEKMRHILGRYELCASDFYDDYVEQEKSFADAPIKLMSGLTQNLLHALDYDAIQKQRIDNFAYLHAKLRNMNKLLIPIIPDGPFMYPLYIRNASEIRKALQRQKIYIPILWPNVLELCKRNELEYELTENVLPLPVDQRYTREDMEYLLIHLEKYML